MKLIVAGSRTITDEEYVHRLIYLWDSTVAPITEIVSGGAAGVDRLGESYAKAFGVPLVVMPAEWAKYGRKAGIMRNLDMARYADGLLAVWDGTSKGTGNMIDTARRMGLITRANIY
jgi:hypothetical protein